MPMFSPCSPCCQVYCAATEFTFVIQLPLLTFAGVAEDWLGVDIYVNNIFLATISNATPSNPSLNFFTTTPDIDPAIYISLMLYGAVQAGQATSANFNTFTFDKSILNIPGHNLIQWITNRNSRPGEAVPNTAVTSWISYSFYPHEMTDYTETVPGSPHPTLEWYPCPTATTTPASSSNVDYHVGKQGFVSYDIVEKVQGRGGNILFPVFK